MGVAGKGWATGGQRVGKGWATGGLRVGNGWAKGGQGVGRGWAGGGGQGVGDGWAGAAGARAQMWARQPTLGSFMTTEFPISSAGISVQYVSLKG